MKNSESRSIFNQCRDPRTIIPRHIDGGLGQQTLNLYDRSNGTFTYESRCCNKGTIEKSTKENTLSIIQANKLKHSYRYTGGERIVLVVDLVTSKRKGLHGIVWGTFDFFWDRIQKFITSFSLQ